MKKRTSSYERIAVDGSPAISVLKLLVLFVSANSSAESLLDIGGEVVVKFIKG